MYMSNGVKCLMTECNIHKCYFILRYTIRKKLCAKKLFLYKYKYLDNTTA